MANTLVGRKRIRKFFGKIREVAEMPNLIEVQKASYDQFLMVDEPEGGRADEGLQSVFKSVFPISEADQGGRVQGRRRQAQGSAREGRRQGRAQVRRWRAFRPAARSGPVSDRFGATSPRASRSRAMVASGAPLGTRGTDHHIGFKGSGRPVHGRSARFAAG